MSITVGQPAPAFTLYNIHKKPVSLQEYRDKKNVLLLFFPLAFTGVCTKELCSVRDGINKYQDQHTEVIGISVDSTYTLAKYAEEQQYQFPLLSDFNKEVSTLYESIYESFSPMGMKGVSKRSAFIIDKDGIVKYAEVLENPGELPNFESIDQQIISLRY